MGGEFEKIETKIEAALTLLKSTSDPAARKVYLLRLRELLDEAYKNLQGTNP